MTVARLFFVGLVLISLPCGTVSSQEAKHLIFVTIDGVRPEDLFRGADPIVMADPEGSGIADTAAFRARWWRPTASERRRAIMPFLWDTLVPMGVLVGDPDTGGRVRVTNGLFFSGPGYMEMFSGHARDDVTSNEDRRYRYATVFDVVLRTEAAVHTDVAAFVSWTTQARLASSRSGTFVSNGPFESLPEELGQPWPMAVNSLEHRVRHHDESIRYDAFTHALAVQWIRRHHPILLHVGYGETDVDAHSRRYDRYLEMLHTTDRMLSELWHAAQADSVMAGSTAIVVTTDHGRGAQASDWTSHGRDVANAERWWFLAAGAGVASRGSLPDGMTQSQVAPTILHLLGVDPNRLDSPHAEPAAFVGHDR